MRFIRTNLPLIGIVYIVAAAVAIAVFAAPLLVLAIPAVLLAALAADAIFRPGSSLLYPTVKHGPRDRKRVALSFDDGPDPEVTPRVLDALAQAGARATFFVIGQSLAAHPELANRIVADGHALGNHSWRHSRWQNFYLMRKSLREIERGEQAIAAVTGNPLPPTYRPPMGLKSPPLARAAYRRKLTLIAWSLHSRDTRTRDPERIARRVLKKIRAGDIVLMHDGHDRPGRHRCACAEAVSLILEGVREKGLTCVTVPELLGLPQ
ncbi:MAG: polysaccharide deacetylase family protein [Gammaproteobacteria bacterium]